MLDDVEWGEFRLGDLFESSNGDFDIQRSHINNTGDYVITSGKTNNGIMGKTDINSKVFQSNTITVDMFGNAFYRQFNYKMVTHARVFSLKPKFDISHKQGLFLANSFHFFNQKFGYENMCLWEKVKDEKVKLPTLNSKIDFNFMEKIISNLELERITKLKAYLTATGLNDYTLTSEEQRVLDNYESIVWGEFIYQNIFNMIVQGRRLTKDDQTPGEIPFVMAGVTNTGVVNYISNPVASFPENSITIDIFGNTFYRNYNFGAGDDTGVYWSDSKKYTSNEMLFFTTAMSKSLEGKFSYGKKLRSSQSYDFKMSLPTKNGQPDYETMETLISAIHKLVIKDVVLFVDKKTQTAINPC